jgi:hypothetical protein
MYEFLASVLWIKRKIWQEVNKAKAIPLQPLTGPEGYRRLRLTDFKTIGKCR